MLTPQMEEYLECLGKLQERGEPLTASAVAREMHVSAPSVTEMLQRLEAQGYVNHPPRQEIVLTPAGTAAARGVIRRHRLWERFLQDVLGLSWDTVHDQACQLEHITSPALEERLAQVTGQPDACPHGYAIPAKGVIETTVGAVPLASLAADQAATIISVTEEPELLRRLSAAGIRPGSEVHIERVEPDGSLLLRSAGLTHTLSAEDAACVLVTPLEHNNENLPASPDAPLPLADLVEGEEGAVQGFRSGRGLEARCLALGFTPGAKVKMLRNLHGGPIIVLVRDTRVALGRSEAQRILVNRLPASEPQMTSEEAAHV